MNDSRRPPEAINGPSDHLATLLAMDLIRDYGEHNGTFWVDMYNGHVIDLIPSEVEVFARGVVYALKYLIPLTPEQGHQIATYDAKLRTL